LPLGFFSLSRPKDLREAPTLFHHKRRKGVDELAAATGRGAGGDPVLVPLLVCVSRFFLSLLEEERRINSLEYVVSRSRRRAAELTQNLHSGRNYK